MYMFSEKMNGNWRKYSLNTGRGLFIPPVYEWNVEFAVFGFKYTIPRFTLAARINDLGDYPVSRLF